MTDDVARVPTRTAEGADPASAVRAAAAAPGTRVLVLGTLPTGLDPAAADDLVAALLQAPQPVVAVLDGPVRGPAAAVALAADLRAWGRGATLRVGPWDGGAVSWTLPRLVGHGRAADLLLRPRRVDAAEAVATGLATVVADDPDAAAEALAAEVGADGATAAAAVKRALWHGASHDVWSTLEHEAQRRAMLARLGGQA